MPKSSSCGQDLIMAPLAKVASEGHHNVKHKLDFQAKTKFKLETDLKI
jgi:hypothetical protein